MKKILKRIGFGFLGIVFLLLLFAGYVLVNEYNPEEVEYLEITPGARAENVSVGQTLNIVSWNTGYAGLDRDVDFFMDGGTGVRATSKETVENNLHGILSALVNLQPDICFLQEVDLDSTRSYYINQADYYRHGLSMNQAYGCNYRCAYVPYPMPPLGKVESGIVTYTNLNVTEASRESLPISFSWPVSVCNLKRGLLIERVPVEGTDRELVLVNLHLEAYDSGEGKVAQTKKLMSLLSLEYNKGNYVIAGGDFNQTFEGADVFPKLEGNLWQAGSLYNSDLANGLRFVFDASSPSCRSLDKPYTGDRENHQFYLIDGFILSDNVKVNLVETVDLNFVFSDHNPVHLEVTLQ